MEILTQLPIEDKEIMYFMSIGLKKAHPQINQKTEICYVKEDYIEIRDIELRSMHDETLKPHHENLRKDIKEEIRTGLNSIINDKNYLMKTADKYYQGKLDYYTTKIHHMEYTTCQCNGKVEFLLYFYHSETDTLYLRQS